MSDSNKPPKPPPDDFSKTTPNIKIPGSEKNDNDWGKTNYKYPVQPPSDDWGNTVANVRPFDRSDDEFGKTMPPSSHKAQPNDWGMTQANIDLRDGNIGFDEPQGEKNEEYGVTTPYFRLPEAERQKYQNIPPTPSEEAKQKAEEKKAKGGIPLWVWISGALAAMFFFILALLLVIYIFLWNSPGFEVVVQKAPTGSSIQIDGSFWGETTPDGSTKLPVLKSGQRNIEIVHPNYKCAPISIVGNDGDEKTVEAKCDKVATIDESCLKIKAGDYETSRKCAYTELGKLSDPPDLDALLRAMNLYINHFDSGKHDIRPEDAKFLETAAGYMKKIPQDTVIEVGGHTDSDGADADNQALSERRANAVKAELIKAGIKESMLVTKGYGESKPKASNDNPDGKFQNRRIQYSVAKQGEKP
ncbi:MAG: OmpA family protein [Pyrinomonadaceae bacterium]|nr:OmpA family protein [Pyrinomonadaceae bacterium]